MVDYCVVGIVFSSCGIFECFFLVGNLSVFGFTLTGLFGVFYCELTCRFGITPVVLCSFLCFQRNDPKKKFLPDSGIRELLA